MHIELETDLEARPIVRAYGEAKSENGSSHARVGYIMGEATPNLADELVVVNNGVVMFRAMLATLPAKLDRYI